MPLHGIKTPHLSELYIPIPTKHLSALLVARQQLSSSLLSPSHHVIPGVPPPSPSSSSPPAHTLRKVTWCSAWRGGFHDLGDGVYHFTTGQV